MDSHTLEFKDGRKFESIQDPLVIEEVMVCYVFFNWFATMEVVFGAKARSEHSPVIFEALSRLEGKKAVEKITEGRWKSTMIAIELAKQVELLTPLEKEWVTERLSNGT